MNLTGLNDWINSCFVLCCFYLWLWRKHPVPTVIPLWCANAGQQKHVELLSMTISTPNRHYKQKLSMKLQHHLLPKSYLSDSGKWVNMTSPDTPWWSLLPFRKCGGHVGAGISSNVQTIIFSFIFILCIHFFPHYCEWITSLLSTTTLSFVSFLSLNNCSVDRWVWVIDWHNS